MATVSLNFPKQTSTSWTFDAASGISVKLRTAISRCHVGALCRASRLENGRRWEDASKNALVAVTSAYTERKMYAIRYINDSKPKKRRVEMAPSLPDDILHVLCEELANLQQFDTLFNCACASRVLAVPALTNLYR
jgi:hypothetical protein